MFRLVLVAFSDQCLEMQKIDGDGKNSKVILTDPENCIREVEHLLTTSALVPLAPESATRTMDAEIWGLGVGRGDG